MQSAPTFRCAKKCCGPTSRPANGTLRGFADGSAVRRARQPAARLSQHSQNVPVLPPSALTDRLSRLTVAGGVDGVPGVVLRLALPTHSVMAGLR